jgi:hypothetical protein
VSLENCINILDVLKEVDVEEKDVLTALREEMMYLGF